MRRLLSKSERAAVIRNLRSYPAGVPSSSWGYGPMQAKDEHDYYYPDVFSVKTQGKYG